MPTDLLRLFLLVASGALAVPDATAADEPPRTSMSEKVKNRMLFEGRKKTVAPVPASTTKSAPAAAGAAATTPTAVEAKPADAAAGPASTATPGEKPTPSQPTVLPQVEVRNSRIDVLDRQLKEKDREIEREKKNTRTTEADLALNDLKIAKPLAIFGGESAQFRQHVANERVELMEAEKDLLEAIAHAKTTEEKQELQRQLDALKAFRRELDQSLR